MEASQEDILAKIQSVKKVIPREDLLQEERDSIIEEIHDQYFDLQDKLDRLPRLSGYYDFQYFNDDREDSPGEFHQHILNLLLFRA